MLADIIVAAIILLSVYMGYKKGFVRTVSKLCCLIISIVVAKILQPYVSVFVRDSFVGDFINDRVVEKYQGALDENTPKFLQFVGEYTLEGITDAIVGLITIILIIVITYIIANFIVNALNIVAKFPLIASVNRLCGMVAGFFIGAFLVYFILTVLVVADVQGMDSWFESSVIAYTMYRHNFIMNFIF